MARGELADEIGSPAPGTGAPPAHGAVACGAPCEPPTPGALAPRAAPARHLLPAASLRVRLVLLVAGIVCALAAPLLLQLPTRMEAISRRWAESRSVGIAELLAAATAPALDFDDPQVAESLLAKLGATRGAAWAALLRPDGEVLARWRDPPAGLRPCPRGAQAVEYAGDLLTVRVPVETRNGEQGTLALAFDLEELRTRLGETHRLVKTGSVVALLGGIALAFFAGTLATRPLRHMARVAERIAGGDLAAADDLATDRRDESGALARAFRAMLARLYEHRDALARANEELGEKLVEIRRMVALLASSEARTRSVIEHARDGIVFVNPDDTIQAVNRAAEQMFGWSQGEAAGHAFSERLIAGASREELAGALRGCRQRPRSEGPPPPVRLLGVRRGGQEFSLECNLVLLVGGRGALCAFLRDLAGPSDRTPGGDRLDAAQGLPPLRRATGDPDGLVR